MGNTRNSTNLLSTDPGNLKREKIRTIPITLIDSANVHPFQVKEDDELRSLMESISQLGVITPCIARRKGEERYELISGHRRKRACELLGIDTLPIIVRELSEDEAVILMVDSNLQREHILPSEKAFAYKLKLDALKRQGKRSDITSTPLVSKFRAGDFVGKDNGDSREQVRRYIRLTYLIPELLEDVDAGKIALRPAVELSYMTEDEQKDLSYTIDTVAYDENRVASFAPIIRAYLSHCRNCKNCRYDCRKIEVSESGVFTNTIRGPTGAHRHKEQERHTYGYT